MLHTKSARMVGGLLVISMSLTACDASHRARGRGEPYAARTARDTTIALGLAARCLRQNVLVTFATQGVPVRNGPVMRSHLNTPNALPSGSMARRHGYRCHVHGSSQPTLWFQSAGRHGSRHATRK